MKHIQAILIGIAVVTVILVVILYGNRKTVSPPVQTSSIVGCYVAHNANDVYTLHIESEQAGAVSGTLAFDNFDKDSSSGSLNGTYKNNILLGDYAFRSEGMDSVMQVVFKKSGNDFIRGYGPVNQDGTRFTDTNNITYDASSALSVFKKESCTVTTSAVTFPHGGENLVAGQTYTLTWSGGPDPIQIFLVNTALKSAGASVSISDRIYGVKNTGSYAYTVPATMLPGTYEFQIGNSTSNTFQVVK
jgi:hypothetical protein